MLVWKCKDGPGSILINPEIAFQGTVPDDLPESVYYRMQLTVDIIGGKSDSFPDGLNGKVTCLGGELFIIPLAPDKTKHFNPDDTSTDEADEENSYMPFRNSHPDTNWNLMRGPHSRGFL